MFVYQRVVVLINDLLYQPNFLGSGILVDLEQPKEMAWEEYPKLSQLEQGKWGFWPEGLRDTPFYMGV